MHREITLAEIIKVADREYESGYYQVSYAAISAINSQRALLVAKLVEAILVDAYIHSGGSKADKLDKCAIRLFDAAATLNRIGQAYSDAMVTLRKETEEDE